MTDTSGYGPENDYGRARIDGMNGEIPWESMLPGEGLDGWNARKLEAWTREPWYRRLFASPPE